MTTDQMTAEELHALLAQETPDGRNAWFEAKEAAGDIAGYIADVQRAWALTEQTQGDGLQIGREIRYALIMSTFNDYVDTVVSPADDDNGDEDDVDVEDDSNTEEGVGNRGENSDGDQSEAAPAEPKTSHSETWLRLRYRTNGKIEDDAAARIRTLAALSPHLSEPQRSRILQADLEVVRTFRESSNKVAVLVALAPYLSKALLPRAQELALDLYQDGQWRQRHDDLWRSIPYFVSGRAVTLTALAIRMLELGQLEDGLAIAEKIQSGLAETVSVLALKLAEAGQAETALIVVRAIENEYYRGEVLTTLAHRLVDLRQPREALRAIQTIGGERQRSRVLPALTPRLVGLGCWKAALPLVQTISDWSKRDEAMIALQSLSPQLPDSLFAQALAATFAIEHTDGRARALAMLAPSLRGREPLLRKALDAVKMFDFDRQSTKSSSEPLSEQLLRLFARHRVVALGGLAPYLPVPLLRDALAMVRELPDQDLQSDGLTALAPYLPESLHREALAMACTLRGSNYRAHALAGLAPYLRQPLLGQALKEAAAIPDEQDRAYALTQFAPHLEWPEQAQILQQALATALAIRVEERRVEALVALVPHFSEPERTEVLQRAWEATRAVGDDVDRDLALKQLAPYLSGSLLQQAVEAAQTVWKQLYHPDWALIALVNRLAELGQVGDAFKLAQTIELQPQRTELLERLALKFAELDRVTEVLAVARIVPEHAYSTIARGLAGLGYVEEALELVRAIEGEMERRQALWETAPHLINARQPEQGRSVLKQAVEMALGYKDYLYSQRVLERLIPILAQTDLFEEAVTAIETFSGESLREVMRVYVSRLSDSQLREALLAFQKARYQSYFVEAIAVMAPRLPALLLPIALDVAQTLSYQGHRSKALTALAQPLASLPQETLRPLWITTLRSLAGRARQDLLSDIQALVPVIIALGGTEAAEEAARAIQDVGRWWP